MYKVLLCILTISLISCTHSPKQNAPQKVAAKNIATGFDAELTTYQYHFEVKYFEFPSQEQTMKMAYMDIPAGRPSAKIIVLMHGKNFSGYYFEQLILGLNQEGYRVIVPDQIGFGKSTKPKNYQYSFQALAQNTKALLNHLQVSRHHLLGHSMGGMLAARFTLMYPDSVSKLILVNPIGLEDWKTMTSYKGISEILQSEQSQTPETLKNYQLSNYYDGRWKADYDKLLVAPIGWLNGPDRNSIAWSSALTADMIFTQPVIYELKNIKSPTVLFIGTRDKTAIGKAWAQEPMKSQMGNYQVLGKTAQKQIKGSRLIELKNLGHMPFIENFEQFWMKFQKEL